MAIKVLEAEFEKLVEETHEKINDKLDIAAKALREAVKISEETGIPFSSHISFLGNDYTPTSFQKLHGDKEFEEDFVSEITGVYNEYEDQSGWQHSAVC